MAEQPRFFTVAPWGHRVLTPWLASAIPVRNIARAFRIVTFTALLAAGGLLFLYLRALGHGMPAAVLGAGAVRAPAPRRGMPALRVPRRAGRRAAGGGAPPRAAVRSRPRAPVPDRRAGDAGQGVLRPAGAGRPRRGSAAGASAAAEGGGAVRGGPGHGARAAVVVDSAPPGPAPRRLAGDVPPRPAPVPRFVPRMVAVGAPGRGRSAGRARRLARGRGAGALGRGLRRGPGRRSRRSSTP